MSDSDSVLVISAILTLAVELSADLVPWIALGGLLTVLLRLEYLKLKEYNG